MSAFDPLRTLDAAPVLEFAEHVSGIDKSITSALTCLLTCLIFELAVGSNAMRRTWLLITSVGFAALAMWPSEAMARWYACKTDGAKEYATDLFEVPEGASNATFERIREDFGIWLRNSPRFPNARSDAYKYGLILCDQKEFFERGMDPDRHVSTGWVPSMGRGTAARTSATPAPRSRVTPATPRPAPAPVRLADDREAARRASEEAFAQREAAYREAVRQREITIRENAEAHARGLAEFEDAKARLAAVTRAAQAEQDRVQAEHQRKLADHQRELASHRALVEAQREAQVRGMEANAKRRDAERKAEEAKAVVPWLEAVVLCELRASDPQAKQGGWYCVGPLQNTHAKLDTPQATLPLGQACGTSSSAKELGITGNYRAFGCGYGLNPNPSASFSVDVARKLGVSFVPGRAVFRCARNHEGNCRTR